MIDGYSLFSCGNHRMKWTPNPQTEKYPTMIFRNSNPRQLMEENHLSAPKPINHINPYHRRAKTMNKKQEQQILDYYSTTDKYIRSKIHSNSHLSVFTKEIDKYQWLVLEQKTSAKSRYGRPTVMEQSQQGIITNWQGIFLSAWAWSVYVRAQIFR